jgi:hypothetical protein
MQLIMQFVMHIFTPERILACHNKGVEYLLTQDIPALTFFIISKFCSKQNLTLTL